uniref:Uncharacterized protein n=1 Tax=Meloidogyne enterolobii TaxID=390850 RepID=A0A6V7UME9_MELEN|nr:unnamed protein product [Meloidogyne enterolobii]
MLATFSTPHMHQQAFQQRASTSMEAPPAESSPVIKSIDPQDESPLKFDFASTQPTQSKQAFRFKAATNRPIDDIPEGPGRRLRKNVANVRKHIDYVANVLNHVEDRLWQHSRFNRTVTQPDILYQNYVLPPASMPDIPVDCVLTKFVRSAMNKVKCPVYSLCWTPEGKRLITGASSGEFTLWNGTAFNFETILQAHDVAIRAMKWSHNDQWLASADHDGFVKYWQPNFNNVHMFQAHKDEPIRSLSFCPTDVKLVTGSDDATARVWDFARCNEERVLRGHGADVRSVDWHPTKALIATGSRDSQQPVKLWDAKTGQCLATLHDHKNSVMAVQWNKNGNWLLTGSRDHVIKLYDVRMMREVQTFRGHKKEVTALAWHPVHEGLFVSGGGDGALGYWLVNNDKELALLEQAHDMAIWTLEWHPMGHILATGSNDNNTKFWTRNRPGDTQEDVFGMTTVGGLFSSSSVHNFDDEREPIPITTEEDLNALPQIPGLGIDEPMRREMNKDFGTILTATSLPGLGGPTNSSTFDQNKKQGGGQFGGRQQPKRNQRQFERMWMVARPSGGQETFEDYEQEEDEDLQQQYLNNEQSGGGPPPPQHFNYLPQQQQNHLIRPPLPPPPQFYHHQTLPPPHFTRPRGGFYPQQPSLHSMKQSQQQRPNFQRFPPPRFF